MSLVAAYAEVCVACGADRPDPDLYPGGFCPMCGHLAGGVDADSAEAVGSSRRAESEVVVSRGREWSALADRVTPKAKRIGLAIGALAVVLVAGLALSNQDDTEIAEPSGASETQPGSIQQDEASRTEEAADDSQAGAAETLEIEVGDVVPGSGPVVGTEVGAYLFAHAPPDLVRIDLDSGDQHWFRMTGQVHVATDTHLVVTAEDGLFALETESPQAGGRLLHRFTDSAEPELSVQGSFVLDDGRVAMSTYRFDGLVPASETVVMDPASSDADVIVFEHGQSWSPVPGLVATLGGGVFDDFAPELGEVFDGRIVAGGGRRLIGDRCDDPTSCRRSVIDRATGEVLIGELPGTLSSQGFDRLVGDDESLLATWFDLEMGDESPDPVQLLDLDTGEVVAADFLAIGTSGATLGVSADPGLVMSLDASSDSRLLAAVGNGVVAIHDRASGENYSIDLELATRSPSTPSRAFFVDKAQP